VLNIGAREPKKFPTAGELASSAGKCIRLQGCVHKIRQMSGFSFIIVRTGRYLFQTIYDPETCKSDVASLKEGCYISLEGLVRADERAAYQFEILLHRVELLTSPKSEYPLQVSHKRIGATLEKILEYRSVSLRNPYERAIFKISEGVGAAFREFMMSRGFTEIHSPKIVSAGAEGGANIFKLKYFEKDAFLAQSPQFYKQAAVAFFDRVFEVAPVYRAEKHNTSRHLNEYIGLDFEMGFIDGMYDVMDMEVAMLKYVVSHLAKHYENELAITEARLPEIGEIPSLTFAEAMELLHGDKGRFRADLDPADEVKLCDWAKEKTGSEFIFVTHFPASERPFYAMEDPENPKLALSFDLLFRGLEITTGDSVSTILTNRLQRWSGWG
jgi:aspartyl/asparaginyl-tRNA synthetase